MKEILLITTITYTVGVALLIFLSIRTAKNAKAYKKLLESISNQTSYYDRETGLASMTMFKDTLTYSTSKPKEKEPLSILALTLDLDESLLDEVQKGILLKNIVKRIKDCLRVTDFITRADDGTFYILLTRVSTTQHIEMVANRILGVFKNDFRITTTVIEAKPYIGIATYPNDDMDLDILISNAHTAMKFQRKEGKTGFHLYKEEGCKANVHLEVLVSDLKEALKNNEFVLHYQPQYSLESNQISGVEALIRWNHPKRGLLTPYHFIDVAENSSFMDELTDWVILEACRQHSAWGIDALKMSVNISAGYFQSQNLIEQIDSAVKETGIKPENLNLEITETVSIANKDYTQSTLQKLKDKGFKVSIDDFGVGQSSLSYIKDYPIDYIKLDRSFIKDLGYSTAVDVVIRSIIRMAQDLHLKVVAEGVETKEQFDFLTQEECTEIQGYYVSKPITPQELLVFITSGAFITQENK